LAIDIENILWLRKPNQDIPVAYKLIV